MNELERFKAIVNFDKPDYVPIFAFPGACGVSWGLMEKDRLRLVEQGMPEWVGKSDYKIGGKVDYWQNYFDKEYYKSWQKYWGTTGPITLDFFPAEQCGEIKSESKIEDDFEIIRYETGAETRQVINNDISYSMPEFRSFHVRDRKSWEFYRDKTAPGVRWPYEKIRFECKKYKNRTKPLTIQLNGTWGHNLRGLMGPEKASTVLFDEPELAKEIINYYADINREYLFPLIDYLKPEIVLVGEDICYNHGMIISPNQFREFCFPLYKMIEEVVHDNNIDVFTVDTDGNAMEFAELIRECGVNSIHPFEVKAGNDLFLLRDKHPDFVMFGWLEKEVLNKGNEHMIYNEIFSKVPRLVDKGGYFPNVDHGIQPYVSFESLCKFMTVLHEVSGNPEGEYQRIK